MNVLLWTLFLVKVWDTVTVPRKPMLALSNLLSHDFIFPLFPVVDVIIDSGLDVAVEKRHCSCVCHSCCRIRGKRWIAVCYFENRHRALKVTRYQQAKSMQSCLPLIAYSALQRLSENSFKKAHFISQMTGPAVQFWLLDCERLQFFLLLSTWGKWCWYKRKKLVSKTINA